MMVARAKAGPAILSEASEGPDPHQSPSHCS